LSEEEATTAYFSEEIERMHEVTSWRELLSRCIADTGERQRVASELGVRPITLTRWATNESDPRPQNLHRLLTALPQNRDSLITLIEEEFPGFGAALGSGTSDGVQAVPAIIPGEFYMRVLQTRATLPRTLRYSVLCDLILQQALKHLDPERSGVGISIARCLPPQAENNVHSLLADMGRGNPPWERNMEQDIMLLGAESLGGYAVMSGRLVAIQELQASINLFPASLGKWEQSAAAAPISLGGHIAGSLIVSSAQPNFFPTVQQSLVGNYADLIALALEPEQFYDPTHIELRVLPPQAIQKVFIASFRQRLLDTMKRAQKSEQQINLIQAEQLVWQQIEEELLLPLQPITADQ